MKALITHAVLSAIVEIRVQKVGLSAFKASLFVTLSIIPSLQATHLSPIRLLTVSLGRWVHNFHQYLFISLLILKLSFDYFLLAPLTSVGPLLQLWKRLYPSYVFYDVRM